MDLAKVTRDISDTRPGCAIGWKQVEAPSIESCSQRFRHKGNSFDDFLCSFISTNGESFAKYRKEHASHTSTEILHLVRSNVYLITT